MNNIDGCLTARWGHRWPFRVASSSRRLRRRRHSGPLRGARTERLPSATMVGRLGSASGMRLLGAPDRKPLKLPERHLQRTLKSAVPLLWLGVCQIQRIPSGVLCSCTFLFDCCISCWKQARASSGEVWIVVLFKCCRWPAACCRLAT